MKSCLCITLSLSFLFRKSIPPWIFTHTNAGSAFYHCLALLTFTFTYNFINFDYEFFGHFWVLLKHKGQPGKKIVNSRNFMFMEDFNHHVFSGLTNIFWVQGETLNRDHFQVYGKMAFCPFFMGYLLTVPVLWSLKLFGVRNCSPWIIKTVSCQ